MDRIQNRQPDVIQLDTRYKAIFLLAAGILVFLIVVVVAQALERPASTAFPQTSVNGASTSSSTSSASSNN